MAGTCVFCGAGGPLTREHVFGDWLSRIGLDATPVEHGAGPLNRLGRDLGVTPPFGRKVRDVCEACNGGWMSQLETTVRQALTPLILGKAGAIDPSDAGGIAAWLQKTALVAMMVSSDEDRARGYGLPSAEYRQLYERNETMEPLPGTHVWLGRYFGLGRLASMWVTPLVLAVDGLEEPAWPQGYAMTLVLGELLLHGVRFTTPGLDLNLSTNRDLQQLWPANGFVQWPHGEPVTEADFLALGGGRELRVAEPHVSLRPWTAATDLEGSKVAGSTVELPAICGKHVVYYPSILIGEAMQGRYYAFVTSCECDGAYLIQTEADGAHCKAAATPDVIMDVYASLPGDEYTIEDPGGRFVCKRLRRSSGQPPKETV